MKTTLNKSQFIDDFRKIRPNQFSYEALGLIFDDIEMHEEMTGEQVEFDPIAFCCQYAESTEQEIISDYDYAMDQDQILNRDANQYAYIMDFLSNKTQVLGDTSNGTIVFEQF